MRIRKELFSLVSAIFAYKTVEIVNDYLLSNKQQTKKGEDEKKKSEELVAYTKKINDANKLINDESNRLITWSLSIIGGSILAMVSTSYIRPAGIFLYTYLLFPVGWIFLGISLYFGELATRIYIAGATVSDELLDDIKKIGREVDKKFACQLKFLRLGIIIFFLWLVSYLIWFIFIKK